MSDKHKQELVSELESIIRLMADIWPNDRENIPEAGAKFEAVIDGFDKNFGQLQKLINLAWEGLKHLFEKDDYFMMVKAATMQAVNTIREYIINDGEIKVEDFERAFEDLEKSLSGGSESADAVIDLDEETIAKLQKEKEEEKKAAAATKEEPAKVYSLNDLASFIMTLDAGSADEGVTSELKQIIASVIKNSEHEGVSKVLTEAQVALEGNKKDWLSIVSEKTEQAVEIESDEEWDESVASETKEEAKEETPAVIEAGTEFYISEDIELEMVGEFITECADLIEMAESALLDLEETPDDDELINTVFRAFHTIKGTSAFMGLDPVSEFTHYVETLLSFVREGELPFDRAAADITFESIDIIKKLLAEVEDIKPGDLFRKPAQYEPMMRILNEISEESVKPAQAITNERGESGAPVVAAEASEETSAENEDTSDEEQRISPSAAAEDSAEKSGSKSDSESSVRVSVGRLDRLIDMVGELVIAHSVVAQDAGIAKDSELQKKVSHAAKILRELQDTSLTLRMVPLKATFHKMNRLVRDLSRKAGKEVKFSTFGEDTEIDRNMVDVINEPLIHMLRNALDHGLETREERAKTDKNKTANISLSASQEGGKVVIKIEDDGRGINKDVIFRKAVEKGLMDPEKKLTEKEIYNLIFLPGFSSAEKVTDLSGRGVGMDVVRRNIEQLQGKVDVESELGRGTTITIELPFTLAITDGMLVRVANERFIVPTINIDMTFRAVEEDLFTVMGNAEQVSFRGKSVPVIRLHRLFDIPGSIEDLLEGTLLVIKNNNSRYALLVDEVVGQQQLVGKSINMLAKTDHISGGAILGDGRVGLILDTAALID